MPNAYVPNANTSFFGSVCVLVCVLFCVGVSPAVSFPVGRVPATTLRVPTFEHSVGSTMGVSLQFSPPSVGSVSWVSCALSWRAFSTASGVSSGAGFSMRRCPETVAGRRNAGAIPNQRRLDVLLRCATATRLHTRCGRSVRAYAKYLANARWWTSRVGRCSFGFPRYDIDSSAIVTYMARRFYSQGTCAKLPVFGVLRYKAMAHPRQGATCGRAVGNCMTCRAHLFSCKRPSCLVLVGPNPSPQ